MTSFQDLTGQRFNRLLVQSRAISKNKWARWLCLCDCGNYTEVRAGNLKSGQVQSCGCARKEGRNATHGQSRHNNLSPEYKIYKNILKRCYYTKFKYYYNYGGRGIRVCDRWRFGEENKSGFECFLEDMGKRPTPKHSIDRFPNNDGNYEPQNCRWATNAEQQWNQLIYISHNGISKTLQEWAQVTGLSYATVKHRYYRGWPIKDMLEKPQRNN